jgi:hypothetical protein
MSKSTGAEIPKAQNGFKRERVKTKNPKTVNGLESVKTAIVQKRYKG